MRAGEIVDLVWRNEIGITCINDSPLVLLFSEC